MYGRELCLSHEKSVGFCREGGAEGLTLFHGASGFDADMLGMAAVAALIFAGEYIAGDAAELASAFGS